MIFRILSFILATVNFAYASLGNVEHIGADDAVRDAFKACELEPPEYLLPSRKSTNRAVAKNLYNIGSLKKRFDPNFLIHPRVFESVVFVENREEFPDSHLKSVFQSLFPAAGETMLIPNGIFKDFATYLEPQQIGQILGVLDRHLNKPLHPPYVFGVGLAKEIAKIIKLSPHHLEETNDKAKAYYLADLKVRFVKAVRNEFLSMLGNLRQKNRQSPVKDVRLYRQVMQEKKYRLSRYAQLAFPDAFESLGFKLGDLEDISKAQKTLKVKEKVARRYQRILFVEQLYNAARDQAYSATDLAGNYLQRVLATFYWRRAIDPKRVPDFYKGYALGRTGKKEMKEFSLEPFKNEFTFQHFLKVRKTLENDPSRYFKLTPEEQYLVAAWEKAYSPTYKPLPTSVFAVGVNGVSYAYPNCFETALLNFLAHMCFKKSIGGEPFLDASLYGKTPAGAFFQANKTMTELAHPDGRTAWANTFGTGVLSHKKSPEIIRCKERDGVEYELRVGAFNFLRAMYRLLGIERTVKYSQETALKDFPGELTFLNSRLPKSGFLLELDQSDDRTTAGEEDLYTTLNVYKMVEDTYHIGESSSSSSSTPKMRKQTLAQFKVQKSSALYTPWEKTGTRKSWAQDLLDQEKETIIDEEDEKENVSLSTTKKTKRIKLTPEWMPLVPFLAKEINSFSLKHLGPREPLVFYGMELDPNNYGDQLLHRVFEYIVSNLNPHNSQILESLSRTEGTARGRYGGIDLIDLLLLNLNEENAGFFGRIIKNMASFDSGVGQVHLDLTNKLFNENTQIEAWDGKEFLKIKLEKDQPYFKKFVSEILKATPRIDIYNRTISYLKNLGKRRVKVRLLGCNSKELSERQNAIIPYASSFEVDHDPSLFNDKSRHKIEENFTPEYLQEDIKRAEILLSKNSKIFIKHMGGYAQWCDDTLREKAVSQLKKLLIALKKRGFAHWRYETDLMRSNPEIYNDLDDGDFTFAEGIEYEKDLQERKEN